MSSAPAAGDRVRTPPGPVLSQAAAACDRARQLAEHTEYVHTENRVVRQAVTDARRERLSSPAHRELLQRSEHMRLQARLATMPVIEQAKGVIMAQSACGERAAFDMLRRASQRSNVPVRDLAATIVAQAAQHGRTGSGPARNPVR